MNSPYYLFLDDERNPEDVTWVNIPRVDYIIVRSYHEFVNHIILHSLPIFVSFDHDLADEHYKVMLEENSYTHNNGKSFHYGSEKTGYDCAKWLVDYCYTNSLEIPQYEVHSMNPVGKERITNYLQWAKKKNR